jgi:hypothetical protein
MTQGTSLLLHIAFVQKWVLRRNLKDPAILASLAVSSIWAAAAAVAVAMWKAAFCTGFQAPRARQEHCRQSPIILPSERHFHSEPSIFKHFGETVPFGKQF